MPARRWPLVFVACFALLLPTRRATAQDVEYPIIFWITSATLIADVGLSAGNGIALAAGTSKRSMGTVGIVTGVATLGMAALNFALTEDDDLRDEFAIVAGTLGLLSTTLGALAVRNAPRQDDDSVVLRPMVFGVFEHEPRVGVMLRQRF